MRRNIISPLYTFLMPLNKIILNCLRFLFALSFLTCPKTLQAFLYDGWINMFIIHTVVLCYWMLISARELSPHHSQCCSLPGNGQKKSSLDNTPQLSPYANSLLADYVPASSLFVRLNTASCTKMHSWGLFQEIHFKPYKYKMK